MKEKKFVETFCTECGKKIVLEERTLRDKRRTGKCQSCSLLGNKNHTTHGYYNSRIYKIWCRMKRRKYNTYVPKVCDEWKDFNKFLEWSLANGYDDTLTIDRIDPRGDYEPSNCQWITLSENAKRANEKATLEPKAEYYSFRRQNKMTLKEMGEKIGVSLGTVWRWEREVKRNEQKETAAS